MIKMTDSTHPRITIVTPSFNQGRFIEATLRSVLDQGYPNLEYIIMDGGSSDDTVSILKRYEDRLTYWESVPDRGQSHAINKGFERATGDIHAYLNSDDLLLPGALAAVADAARANPGADLFHGRCVTIDVDGHPLERTFHGDITTPEEILDLWQVWWGGRNFVQPEVFWRRRVAEQVGPFREELYYAMDYDYWCRVIVSGGKVCRLDRTLAAFRIWGQQKSTAAEKAAGEMLAVVAPYLVDPRVPIPSAKRRRLRGNLAFDTRWRPLGTRPEFRQSRPLTKRITQMRLMASAPELFFSGPFRDHMGRALRRTLGAKRPTS